MIKELALRKLAYAYEDEYEDALSKKLKNIDFTNNVVGLGTLIGGYKLSKKYGTDFSKWGDSHINSILSDDKASTLAKSYAKNMPKNKWVRGAGALLSNVATPILLSYGIGSILNKLKEN